MEMIAFDSHRRYTLALVETETGQKVTEARLPHERGAIMKFLRQFPAGSPVAVETVGNWYWIVDEIEAAEQVPRLTHARKAKVMMGCVNKTDHLDVHGLNRLQRLGSLPTVWIPPHELRDQRELVRTRMELVQERTRLKNRLLAAFAKYAVNFAEVQDAFGKRGRTLMIQRVAMLPAETQFAVQQQLVQLDSLTTSIAELEARLSAVIADSPAIVLVRSLPGIGWLLSVVIVLEVGDVSRFSSPEKLAAYAGTTPRVHASGGKIRFGAVRADVNRYLKWAFAEAANSICAHRHNWPQRHVVRLYERIRHRKGHAKAIGAVSRHLAEATYWVLRKQEAYREPAWNRGSPTKA